MHVQSPWGYEVLCLSCFCILQSCSQTP